MKFSCPECGSENTQRQSLAYAGGTAEIEDSGIVSGSNGSASYSGTSTASTPLAQRCRPPERPRFFAEVIGGPLGCGAVASWGVLSLLTVIGLVHDWTFKTWCVLALAIAVPLGLFFFSGWRRKAQKYPSALAEYERSWICHRCGRSWSQKAES
jgi:hypothetical protein